MRVNVRWLGAIGIAVGSAGAAVWMDAPPALVLAFISAMLAILCVVLAVVWIFNSDAPTERLIRVINALKGAPRASACPGQLGGVCCIERSLAILTGHLPADGS